MNTMERKFGVMGAGKSTLQFYFSDFVDYS